MKRFLYLLRVWSLINLFGDFVYPKIEMKYIRIVAYPAHPYQTAIDLGMSPFEYWKQIEFAMGRQSAAMLDTLGFLTGMTDEGRRAMAETAKAIHAAMDIALIRGDDEMPTPFNHISGYW